MSKDLSQLAVKCYSLVGFSIDKLDKSLKINLYSTAWMILYTSIVLGSIGLLYQWKHRGAISNKGEATPTNVTTGGQLLHTDCADNRQSADCNAEQNHNARSATSDSLTQQYRQNDRHNPGQDGAASLPRRPKSEMFKYYTKTPAGTYDPKLWLGRFSYTRSYQNENQ